tara:strand:+ start:339 stop:1265 length:927 start_codon:yes stop_codon:yes gene_type:complete
MSQFLETFATFCFPFGIYGCGIQMKKYDNQVEIYGSSDYASTYFSFLMWTAEVASLVLAAILSVYFASSIEFGATEKELNENIVNHILSAVNLNMIAFITRAGFVFLIYIINTFSCCTFECARCTSSYLFCGNVWFTTEKSARNTCLILWLIIEQIMFLAPAYTLYNMIIHNIESILTKSCLQMGTTACGSDCLFKYMPWETYDFNDATEKPMLSIFLWMYVLYFAAPVIRILRQILIYMCINTIVGNNATTHNSVSNDKEVVEDVIVTLLNQPRKQNYSQNYGYNKVYNSPNDNFGLRKRKYIYNNQ